MKLNQHLIFLSAVMACSTLTAAIFLGMFMLTGTNAYASSQGQSLIVWVVPLLVYIFIGRLVGAKALIKIAILSIAIGTVATALSVQHILTSTGEWQTGYRWLWSQWCAAEDSIPV